jgi:hypothetical protein
MPSRTRNGVATTGTSGGVTAAIGGTLKIDPVAVGWASLNFRLIQAFDGSIWTERYSTPSAGSLGTVLKFSLRSFLTKWKDWTPLALQIYACWQKERGLAFLYYRGDRMGCVVVTIALQPASVMATTHIYLTGPKMSLEVIHGSTQERTKHPVNIHSTSTLPRSNGVPTLSPPLP